MSSLTFYSIASCSEDALLEDYSFIRPSAERSRGGPPSSLEIVVPLGSVTLLPANAAVSRPTVFLFTGPLFVFVTGGSFGEWVCGGVVPVYAGRFGLLWGGGGVWRVLHSYSYEARQR